MKDMAPANLLIELVTAKLKLLRDSSHFSCWRLLQKIKLHSERGDLGVGDLPPDPALFQEFVADVEKSIQSKARERLQSVELVEEWKPFAAILAIKPDAAALKEPLKQLTKGRRLGEECGAQRKPAAVQCM